MGSYRGLSCTGVNTTMPGQGTQLVQEASSKAPQVPSWCQYVPVSYRGLACNGVNTTIPGQGTQLVQEASSQAPQVPSWCQNVPEAYRGFACGGHGPSSEKGTV